MKKWISSLLVGMLFLFLMACGQVDDTAGNTEPAKKSEDDGEITIAMTVINQEALFFTDMVKGAQEAADKLGVKFTVHNANNDTVGQHNSVEDFISSGVDAIIVNAIDSGGMKSVVEKAKKAGIYIISVDSIIQSDAVDVQIGVDNYESSVELGKYFNEFIKSQYDGQKIKLGVVGALNSPIQINREDGFKDTIANNENLEIVNTVDGENVQEKALTASENLLTGSPDLTFAFATGEPAFIGLVSAVRSQKAEDRVKLFGWDLSKQVIEGIDAGFVEAVVQQHPFDFGSEAVNAAKKLIDGETVEKQLNVPVSIVTKENIDEYRDSFK
ncbi:substrate-binding domain-containing protein [Bacillus sp. DTU_2020_1000418_1_SI_GHA_SEK_038]|uniref:substrate-binding domain-containing protein n=1 Tax=Bacillus sp. DTU_2020_1000418_1_SI_GHA_SEK_038 TaxID=3077585 RepID=UPI0028E1961F|nr:substrate-binding domain-containing protein [Bacillus sp. DTU_2020_1000418_1_SI_GHA_SEK_038]WNS73666.1 substrate-binding domain-containing protein [Bacillus sp. DTU_2020_1000418_1_SI_GHA_SEK_038]